jgi:predicted nucleotidyltransferase
MNKLNLKVWDEKNNLREDIREKLIQISKIFLKSIETPIEVKNIFLTGSLASYQWRPTSDFDLHIIVDVLDKDCLDTSYDYFDSKSKIFNKEHDIYIKGYKVEVNLKDKENLLRDKGVYDILQNKWIAFPKKAKREMDDPVVLSLAEDLKTKIDSAISEKKGIDALKDIRNQIKKLRVDGLEKEGEYSVGNLVFKKLRHDGYIEKLYSYKSQILNKTLSLESFRFYLK